MSEVGFEQQVLKRLDRMERKVNRMVDYIDDTRLTASDRRALRQALKEEKEGKLISHSDLKKQLGL